jgi:ABC-type uncharacterized transport system substrate-binding protein
MNQCRNIAGSVFKTVLLWCCLCSVSLADENFKVLLVASDSKPLYQTFLRALAGNLHAGVKVSVLERAEDFDAQAADLIVTVGVKAAERVIDKSSLPLLATMIPSNTYAGLLAKRRGSRKISAIFLDQPLSRQIRLLRAALPERRKIGVLHDADTKLDIPSLRAELASLDGVLITRALHSQESLFADLEEVLVASDVLLAMPESEVYNSTNIRNILLSSYRRGIPLVGFSQAYVKAGALCAIFSTPEQLAAQTGAEIISFTRTARLSEAQFPLIYTIAINQEVARTLGLTLNSAEMLHLQVEKFSGNSR